MSKIKENAINELAAAMGVSKDVAEIILNGMIMNAKLEVLSEKVRNA